MRSRKDFASNMQYKKYLLAVEYADRIKYFQDKGYLIFEPEGTLLQGKIDIPENDDWTAIRIYDDGCSIGLLCFAYGDDNIPWIEETMKQIHEIFRGYKCVNPKHIHNIKIKKPKLYKQWEKENEES
jgi:hypothetical protein